MIIHNLNSNNIWLLSHCILSSKVWSAILMPSGCMMTCCTTTTASSDPCPTSPRPSPSGSASSSPSSLTWTWRTKLWPPTSGWTRWLSSALRSHWSAVVVVVAGVEWLQAEVEPKWLWRSQNSLCSQRENMAARHCAIQQVGSLSISLLILDWPWNLQEKIRKSV